MLNNLNVTIEKKIEDFTNHSINDSSSINTQSDYSDSNNSNDNVTRNENI